ncbi:MAG: hypothetical protein ABH833_01125 [Parcubacteria group bacterium]
MDNDETAIIRTFAEKTVETETAKEAEKCLMNLDEPPSKFMSKKDWLMLAVGISILLVLIVFL